MTDASRERAAQLVREEVVSLGDLSIGYPANHFAWQVILSSAAQAGARDLIEVGVGSGNGVAHVVNAGLGFAGIDRDPSCVDATRAVAADLGVDPGRITVADIEDAQAVARIEGAGSFDTLVALGVLPHAADEARAVHAMASLVRPGGELFIEYRNSLFSLVTFNRFTHSLVVNDLLADSSPRTQQRVSDFISPRLDMQRPPLPTSGHEAAYHNPLALPDWFRSQGFREVSVHPFHYHAAMPALEADDPVAFRAESLQMDAAPSGWKGLFLCSAFLVRAVRPT